MARIPLHSLRRVHLGRTSARYSTWDSTFKGVIDKWAIRFGDTAGTKQAKGKPVLFVHESYRMRLRWSPPWHWQSSYRASFLPKCLCGVSTLLGVPRFFG